MDYIAAIQKLNLNHYQKHILITLVLDADKWGHSRTGLRELSSRTGIERGTLIKWLKSLENEWFIKINRRTGKLNTISIWRTKYLLNNKVEGLENE